MSKYIKLYDAIMAMAEWFSEPITPTQILSDLPTLEVSDKADRPFEYFEGYEDGRKSIEVSEGNLYIPLNNQTVERINRLHKDECGEYFDEEWLFNELEQISEFREVSEDCISREYLLSKVYDMDNDNLVVDYKDIMDAPSVVPKAKEGEWKLIKENVNYISSLPKREEFIANTYQCSECGNKTNDRTELPEICPWCGTEMERIEE